jgi:glycosyltransferase involved in cell wall biosynthesis
LSGPAFSICIPNFNHGGYIGETIESVLRQTYENFEVVVVDNASTDDSVKVVRSFGPERVRLYQNPYNVGFAPNLDRAASKARNDFIIVLSSDDLMLPAALASYASVIQDWGERADQTLIGSAYEQIDGQGRVIGSRDRLSNFTVAPARPAPVELSSRDAAIFEGRKVFADVFPRMMVPSQFCTTAFSKALYESVGGYGSVNLIGPDAHLAYKCLLRNAWMTFVDRPLFQYRVHVGGQIGQSRRDAILKVPIDRYVFSFAYSDDELGAAGVKRSQIIEYLIDESCATEGARQLRDGSWIEALRHLLFAFASYPRSAIRRPRIWGLVAAMTLGPLAGPAMRMFVGARRRVGART